MTPTTPRKRRLSRIVLCVSLLIVTVIFGVRIEYSAAAYYTLAIAQLTVICVAAWKCGASAIRVEAGRRRNLAIAGGLLVMTWALLSFLPGLGPPWVATARENELRYTILVVAVFTLACGLAVLRLALSHAGERFCSNLGFVAIMLASPLYATFAIIQLCLYRSTEQNSSHREAPWASVLDELGLFLLFFGVVLTYLATACFATALGQVRWLGRTSSITFVGTSLLAILCVAIKIATVLMFPKDPTWNFAGWYAIPGNVLAIPAIPWIMPCLLGVILLRRAGEA